MNSYVSTTRTYFPPQVLPAYSDVTSVELSQGRMPESPSSVKAQQLSAPSGRTSAPVSSHKVPSGMNGAHSPHSGTPSGRTPSPPSGAHPNPVSLATTVPSTVSSSTDLSLAGNVRQLGKLKRFLATLQQFGVDVSPDAGERMHSLIISLVSSTLSIEDFSQKVQDLTNYAMRPFVVPFLKSSLPLLQAELLHFARLAKQTPQQYIRQHEQLIIDTASHPGGEPFEIFQDNKDSLKRRTPPDVRSRENGYSDSSSDGPPPAKRQQTLTSPTLGSRMSPAGSSNLLPPSLNFRYDDGLFRERERYERYDRYDRELCRPYYGSVHREFPDDRDMEDEWKNIHTMLNCILGMVEKTKRALAILQHRSYADRQDNLSLWRSTRHLDGTEFDLKKRTAELLQHGPAHHHYKATPASEERVCDVRRRPESLVTPRQPPLLPLAEDAVHEVKRQAVAELHKAVTAAESKASELLAAERAKMERMLSEARRQAAEETMAAINHQDESTESCWNCGRKANETCSGCNLARYCGAFCQHKDWENHHKVCGQNSGSHSASTPSASTPASGRASPSVSPNSSSPTSGKQSPRPPSARTIAAEIKSEPKN